MGSPLTPSLLELLIFFCDPANQMFCLNVIDFAELSDLCPSDRPVLLDVIDDHLLLLDRLEAFCPHIFRLHMEPLVER